MYPYGGIDSFQCVPFLAIFALVSKRMLTATEADLIRAVASGEASHEFLTQEAAQRYTQGLE
jgi:hypothetical protein